MVRPRRLVIAALVASAVVAAGTAPGLSAQDGAAAPQGTPEKKEKPTPFELRPYRIRAWVSVDPSARLDYRGREALIAGWKAMMERFVGRPWRVEVAEGDGPMLAGRLEDLQPEAVAPQAQGFDKAWMIQVRPLPGSFGLALYGREFDSATGLVGLVGQRPAAVPEDAARSLFLLSLDLFTPTAEIGKKLGGGVTITVQGSMLPASDPVGQVVQVGSVFQAVRVHYKPDGSVAKVLPIQRTYLRVASLDGPTAYCSIITKLRDPLTNLVLGRFKVVGVGIKPSAVTTRLRFVTKAPENRPAAGYTLMARPAPDGPWRDLATTDRDGRVVLPPHFDSNLVILRLVAADLEPLDEFPIMPGEMDSERTIVLRDTKDDAVTLESGLNSLRDELVDQANVRARLEALLKPRAEGEQWDEVRMLLEEYDKLPKRPVYDERLAKLREAAKAKQEQIKKPVLTRTAQMLLNETQALVERYIDDETFNAYADAYDRYAATAPPEKARKRTLSTDRPESALSKLATPSAASAGQEETRAGLVEFLPPGLGIRLAMPTTPVETTGNVDSSDGPVPERIYTVEDPAKGTFRLTLFEQKRVIAGQNSQKKALDRGRQVAASGSKGSKLVADREIQLEGRFPGREAEIEYRPEPEAPKHMVRVRTFVVNNRVITIGVRGTEAQVRARVTELFLDSFRLTEIPPVADPKAASSGGPKAEDSAESKPTPDPGGSQPKGAPAEAKSAPGPTPKGEPPPEKPKGAGSTAPPAKPF